MDESSIPKSEAQREAKRKYMREYMRKYIREYRKRNPEKYRQYSLNWKNNANYSAVAARFRRKWRANNPEKYAAHRALKNAVRLGKVAKPDQCSRCGNAAQLHGHHHLGYAPEHRLDVIWLCDPCHKLKHSR